MRASEARHGARRRVSALSDAVDRVAIEGAEAVDHRAEHSAVEELLG